MYIGLVFEDHDINKFNPLMLYLLILGQRKTSSVVFL